MRCVARVGQWQGLEMVGGGFVDNMGCGAHERKGADG